MAHVLVHLWVMKISNTRILIMQKLAVWVLKPGALKKVLYIMLGMKSIWQKKTVHHLYSGRIIEIEETTLGWKSQERREIPTQTITGFPGRAQDGKNHCNIGGVVTWVLGRSTHRGGRCGIITTENPMVQRDLMSYRSMKLKSGCSSGE